MIELATLVLVGLVFAVVVAVFSLVAFVLHGILWLFLLPFRLLFGLILLPFLVLKFVIGGIFMLIVAPIVAIVTIIAVLATILAVGIPLLPFIIVGAAIYILFRNTSPVPAR